MNRWVNEWGVEAMGRAEKGIRGATVLNVKMLVC